MHPEGGWHPACRGQHAELLVTLLCSAGSGFTPIPPYPHPAGVIRGSARSVCESEGAAGIETAADPIPGLEGRGTLPSGGRMKVLIVCGSHPTPPGHQSRVGFFSWVPGVVGYNNSSIWAGLEPSFRDYEVTWFRDDRTCFARRTFGSFPLYARGCEKCIKHKPSTLPLMCSGCWVGTRVAALWPLHC
jgi:hypothetical protein